jgi:hypothetical protein
MGIPFLINWPAPYQDRNIRNHLCLDLYNNLYYAPIEQLQPLVLLAFLGSLLHLHTTCNFFLFSKRKRKLVIIYFTGFAVTLDMTSTQGISIFTLFNASSMTSAASFINEQWKGALKP